MSQLPLEILRDIAGGSPVVYSGQQGIEEGLAFVRIYAAILVGEHGSG